MNKKDSFTSVVALGGLGEVGKNMYVITHKDEIFIIDAGVIFPESDLLGVDYVIQDITYLKQNERKIKGLLITHGHEDHIGGIPFLLQTIKIPVIYGARTSLDLIKNKLEDREIGYDNLELIDSDKRIKTKYFDIEFIATTHSIPDSFGIVLHTPNGTIVSTGDFKFDLTPIGPIADLHKMARVGNEGVKLLLSDSTNALSEGFSKSENCVDEALADIVNGYNGRIIIATFASNTYRIKHIVETCKKNNRKIKDFQELLVQAKSLYDNETAKQLSIDTKVLLSENEMIQAAQEKRDIAYKRLITSAIYLKIKHFDGTSTIHISEDEWRELGHLLDESFDNLTSKLIENTGASELELRICYLRKIDVSPVLTANILNRGCGAISMARKRLYTKLTGKNGSAQQFDEYLMSL